MSASTRSPSSRRSCKYIDLPLQHASDAVLKRMKRPGHARSLREAARQHPRAHPERHAAHDVHRRFPRRDRRRTSTSSRHSSTTSGSITSACSPTRTRKARRRTTWPTTCRRHEEEAAGRLMARQKRSWPRARRRGVGERGPPRRRRPVARARAGRCSGRLHGQAPDIDPRGLPDRLRPIRRSCPRDASIDVRESSGAAGLRPRSRRRAALSRTDGQARARLPDAPC